ncbi:MAG TPA: hypothetical protein VHP61_00015 [Acidobacteriota bacterium]|nr:hypothetical protein [Acidobacteriota bacterium]
MKSFKIVFALLVLSVAAFAQTKDLGLGAFANDKGPIMLAVDAGVAGRDLASPYVMFVVWMASKDQKQDIVVDRKGVTLVYNGQEHKMPPFKELRKNYGAEIRDITLYRHLGKEGIASSWIRFYKFPNEGDFFPPQTARALHKTDRGSMSGFHGFVTKLYFKNPGFKKGDKIVIRVTAKNKPELSGEVAVLL